MGQPCPPSRNKEKALQKCRQGEFTVTGKVSYFTSGAHRPDLRPWGSPEGLAFPAKAARVLGPLIPVAVS